MRKNILKDLIGNRIASHIDVTIICDESGTENWLYYGMLIIPDDILSHLLQDIKDIRCGNKKRNWRWGECGNISKCSHHVKNNSGIDISTACSHDRTF